MCGIVGVMSSILNVPEKDTFRDLLNIASFRGREGSGVIVVGDTHRKKPVPDVRSLKSKGISSWLAYSPDLEELLKKPVSIAIGHARWPTKGGADLKSIHPHRTKHIIGVHNGTMYEVAGKKVEDKESDSAAIFAAIAEKGIEEVWKTSSGAAALVWIDEHDQTLNMIRNSGRPLWFKNAGWNKNISTMYWASETSMFDFVLPRHFKPDNLWTTYLPENVHFKWSLDVQNVIHPLKTVKIEKPVPVYTQSSHSPYEDDTWWETYGEPKPPFEGGRFVKDTASHALSDPGVTERAAEARKRLAERMAEVRKERAEKEKAGTIEKVGEASRHSPSAPPFHQSHLPALRQDANFQSLVEKNLNDDVSDIPRRTRQVNYLGRKCCWCGDVATEGDEITPIYQTDMGSREFLCKPCTANPSCIDSGFLSGNFNKIFL